MPRSFLITNKRYRHDMMAAAAAATAAETGATSVSKAPSSPPRSSSSPLPPPPPTTHQHHQHQRLLHQHTTHAGDLRRMRSVCRRPPSSGIDTDESADEVDVVTSSPTPPPSADDLSPGAYVVSSPDVSVGGGSGDYPEDKNTSPPCHTSSVMSRLFAGLASPEKSLADLYGVAGLVNQQTEETFRNIRLALHHADTSPSMMPYCGLLPPPPQQQQPMLHEPAVRRVSDADRMLLPQAALRGLLIQRDQMAAAAAAAFQQCRLGQQIVDSNGGQRKANGIQLSPLLASMPYCSNIRTTTTGKSDSESVGGHDIGVPNSPAGPIGSTVDALQALHTCSDCGRAYSTPSNLARHRQTHRIGAGTTTFDYVHDSSSSSLSPPMARHSSPGTPTTVDESLMITSSPPTSGFSSTSSSSQSSCSPLVVTPRKCPHCDKVYASAPAYSMHVRTHSQGCACPQCGKRFSRPWLLQGHLRTHTGEKPFRCTHCGKTFADKSNLRAHVQTHSADKPHVCGRCGKAFALRSYLYKHEESSCMRSHRLYHNYPYVQNHNGTSSVGGHQNHHHQQQQVPAATHLHHHRIPTSPLAPRQL